MTHAIDTKTDAPWEYGEPCDILSTFQSCLGYSRSPLWGHIQQRVREIFTGFQGLRTIELGCGEGKVSLLFSLLGAKTTLVDNSHSQLERARYLADQFSASPLMVEVDLLRLPESFWGEFDVSMSFGTAEHFFGPYRQRAFDVHWKVLRKGGLTIICVPNRYGMLFHLGVSVRKLFRRQVCGVPEEPFTRAELRRHAGKAGFIDAEVLGAESLLNDFNMFVFDLRGLFSIKRSRAVFDSHIARKGLLECMQHNHPSLKPWNNLFSYPLLLFARKSHGLQLAIRDMKVMK